MSMTMHHVGAYEASIIARAAEARRRLNGPPARAAIVIPPKAKTTFDLVMENDRIRPIILNVCADLKIKPETVLETSSGKRNRARDEILAQVHEETGWSFREIGKVFRSGQKAVTAAVRRVRPVTASVWTKHMVSELTRMHGLGVSCSVMAAVLGTSRNAIIGKVSRLGLSNTVKFSTELSPASTLSTDEA